MGIHFRKRVKIMPGVYMNIGKKSTSFSVGPRGAKLNFGKNGIYINAGIPGTGIYVREKISGTRKNRKNNAIDKEEMRRIENEVINNKPLIFMTLFISFFLAVMIPLLTNASWIWCPIIAVLGFCCAIMFNTKESKKEEIIEDNVNEQGICISSEANSAQQENGNVIQEEHPHIDVKEVLMGIALSDPLLGDAAILVVSTQQASTSMIQRKYSIGYNRAERIMEQLEKACIVTPATGSKPRSVICKNSIELESQIALLDNDVFNKIIKEERDKEPENCSRLIKLGIDLEKEGMIDEAINAYEKSITPKLPARHPYERLAILYRKKKDYKNEIRILKTAIEVFMKENERRAGRVIDKDGPMYEEVMLALETNESIRYEDGKWAFVQYDVMEYITRLEKAKKLLERSQLGTKTQ